MGEHTITITTKQAAIIMLGVAALALDQTIAAQDAKDIGDLIANAVDSEQVFDPYTEFYGK